MKTACIPVKPNFIAIIDVADREAVEQFTWFAVYSGRNVYAQATQQRGLLMHRLILGLKKGDRQYVDHRDRCGLNNRRQNLRIASQSQNCANSRQRVGTQSGFKGVSPAPSSSNGWRAEVRRRVNGKMERHYLGSFPTPELAARAYDAKAVELYGEFACLNFPSPLLPASGRSIAHMEVAA